MRSDQAGTVAAAIRAVTTHVPEGVLSNAQLASDFPDWPAAKILDKTGIAERRIAGTDETASDLAFAAATKLFAASGCPPDQVDFVILCTQAPDYVLPTTACLLQERLGLRRDVGALDINLGCSGFVYGLSLAAGLIAGRMAQRVLLLTADTYSKYIHPADKSVRTLFGDGAAATLIEAAPAASSLIGPFVFGTDGSGARDLIVEVGGFRRPALKSADSTHNQDRDMHSPEHLYMHGGNVMSFSLKEVPRTYQALLEKAGLSLNTVDHVVLHQANKFMLDALQKKLGVPSSKFPRFYETVGNTVSSTIPFVLEDLLTRGLLVRGHHLMMIGFGVGLSWAGAVVRW